MTDTAEHVLSAPEADPWALNRPVRVTCTCGWRSRPVPRSRVDGAAQSHRADPSLLSMKEKQKDNAAS